MKIEQLPKKYRDRIDSIEDDRINENGWWIHLKGEWVCDSSAAPHTIHEDTFANCFSCLKETRKAKLEEIWE